MHKCLNHHINQAYMINLRRVQFESKKQAKQHYYSYLKTCVKYDADAYLRLEHLSAGIVVGSSWRGKNCRRVFTAMALMRDLSMIPMM